MEKENVKEKLEKELNESIRKAQVKLRTIKILDSFHNWVATQCMTRVQFYMVYSACYAILTHRAEVKEEGGACNMEKQNAKENLEKELKESLCEMQVSTSKILASFDDWVATQSMTRVQYYMVYSTLSEALNVTDCV